MKSSKSPFKFKEHRHSVLKVPGSFYPQMCTGLLVLSTGKSAPPHCRLEGGMPRDHSHKDQALALSAAFLGAY